MTSPPLSESVAEVWEHLVTEGGMQPAAWDEPLVDELRAKLHRPDCAHLREGITTRAEDVWGCGARDVSRIGPATDCETLRNVGLG